MIELTWVGEGDSESIKKTESFLKEISLDNVYTNTAVCWPGGIKQETITKHRLGDYFKEINIEAKESTIEITFIVNPEVSSYGRFRSYWKDLIVMILCDTEKNSKIKFKRAYGRKII